MSQGKAKVIVVIGGAWGDEGKGKVASAYSKDANLVIRATGGANAGHTVFINDQKIALHLIPGGIAYPQAMCLIGQGTVIDMEILMSEIEKIGELVGGSENVKDRLRISGTASVVMPYHKVLDEIYESRKTKKIGTTKNGIGPAYADKINRIGLKIYDLLLPVEKLEKKIDGVFKHHKNDLLDYFTYSYQVEVKKLAEKYHEFGEKIKDMVVNGQQFVREFVNNPENTIVVEGAQAVRLSIEVGDYPNVTSSDANTLGTLSGAHLSHRDVTEVVNIYKAYFSRVGNGPFPTEYESHVSKVDGKLAEYDEPFIGDSLREFAHEFGATTGRPRRVGAFDAVLAKTSAEVSGANYMCINHLDTIGEFANQQGGRIDICVGYKYCGKEIDFYPDDMELTGQMPEPIYQTFESGWELDENIKSYYDLPKKAKLFISFIENYVKIPVKYIGIGPKNEDLLIRNDI